MVKKDYYLILRVKKLSVETQDEIADEIERALNYDSMRCYFHHKNLVVIPSRKELTAVLEVMHQYKIGGVIKPYHKQI